MDKAAFVLVLCLVSLYADVSSGQDLGDVHVTIFGPAKRLVKKDDTISLTCHVNAGLRLFMKNRLLWKHVSLTPGADPEGVVLSENNVLKADGSPDLYEVSDRDDASNTNITLTIKKVIPEMDGYFICVIVAVDGDTESPVEKVELVVLSEVETISMTFDGEEPITGVDTIAVEREEGEYGVTCQAAGFNPTATIQMFVGDTELVTDGTSIEMDPTSSKAANSRRYRARATASNVQFQAQHSGQTLRCEAYSNKDDRFPMEASVPLLIIALEPTIVCENNNSARPDDLYVKISCIVDHSKVEVDRYSFEIGKTGTVVIPDQLSEALDEVTVKEIAEHKTQVTLDLYKVKSWHFDSYYYLDVYTKSGQRFRETTSLVKLAPISASDPSIHITSKSFLFAACFLISSLLLSL